MRKETLEEAAYRLSAEKFEPKHIGFMLGVIEGAKWQSERMYSEEEVIAIVEKSRATGLTAEYLIEQFKKK